MTTENFEAVCSNFGEMDCIGGIEEGFDPWAELDLSRPEADHVTPTNLEEIYAGIHKSIDQAVSTISQQISQEGPFTPENIKQQNRKVVEKLSGLENEILLRTPPNSTRSSSISESVELSQSDSLLDLSFLDTPASALDKVAPSQSLPTTVSRTPTKRRKLRPKDQVHTNNVEINTHSQHEKEVGELSAKLRSNPKLAHKALQIGNPNIASWVREFAVQLQDQGYRTSCKSMPEAFGFPAMTEVMDGSHFVQMLPKLALAIECNIFGEQDHKIRKRIALAHFYHVYTLAQENPQTFLSWCDGQQMKRSMLPKGGYKSVVQHRFADLMFPQTEHRSGSATAANANDWLKTRIGKIQTWRKNGKHWAKLIMRFGYGVLLLMPPCLTDEDLRLAHNDEMADILDLIDSRKRHFSDALNDANQLLSAHFFAQKKSAPLPDPTPPDLIDFDEFLRSTGT